MTPISIFQLILYHPYLALFPFLDPPLTFDNFQIQLVISISGHSVEHGRPTQEIISQKKKKNVYSTGNYYLTVALQ